MNEGIFREYDIRGIVETDFPDDVVLNIGKAYGTTMARRGHKLVSVGYDLRISSEHLQDVFIQGIRSTGLDVISIGQVTTPTLYFSIVHLGTDGGVMITGSHNPIEFNGFKMNDGMKSVYGQDIQDMKKIFEGLENEVIFVD